VADDPLIGKIIAGHRLVELIGQGGQSVVYVAEHLRLGRRRAIKLLPARFAQDQEARARFEEEWKAAAAIEHAGIVEVFDAGEVDGELYIVMQYVPGSDLGGLVAAEGPLEPERALRILEQVAQALDAAHAAGLVHRDIKSANILVGEGDRAYLSDFGVAKLARAGDSRTRAGYFIGTADYAAPEQIEDRDVDGRADVYSLGCVLYYCLTGTAPFPRDNQTQVMLAQLHDPPPRPTASRPDLPPALDTVLGKALAKDRDERYATCREFVAAARDAAAQPVPAAPPPRPASPPTVAVPTPRSGDTAPAGGIPVPVEAPLPRPAPAPVAGQPPPAAPRRRRRVGLTAVVGGLAGFAVLAGIGLVIWFAALKPGAKAASPPVKRRPPAGERTFELEVCRDFTADICAEPGFTRPATETEFVVVQTVTNVRAGDTVHFVLKDPTTGGTLVDSGDITASKGLATAYFLQRVGNGGAPIGARSIEIDVYFNGGLRESSATVVFR
jgi:serine/threonine-protein kinase